MKLQDNLYSVKERNHSDKGFDFMVCLNADHTIYQAHFPGQPITPGVCIIQIAKELLEDIVGRSLAITQVKNVKFLKVISPLETPEICYSLQVDESTRQDAVDKVKVQVKVVSGEDIFTKMSFVCQVTT